MVTMLEFVLAAMMVFQYEGEGGGEVVTNCASRGERSFDESSTWRY